jgi:hypothetical protein
MTPQHAQEFKIPSKLSKNSLSSMHLNLRGGKDNQQASDVKSKKRDPASDHTDNHNNSSVSNDTVKSDHGMDMKSALKQVCFGLCD